MTDTRFVSIDQIAAGYFEINEYLVLAAMMAIHTNEYSEVPETHLPRLLVKQVGDASGGDVYEPTTPLEASLVEGLRRAKWPHPVQVEVVNG